MCLIRMDVVCITLFLGLECSKIWIHFLWIENLYLYGCIAIKNICEEEFTTILFSISESICSIEDRYVYVAIIRNCMHRCLDCLTLNWIVFYLVSYIGNYFKFWFVYDVESSNKFAKDID